MKNKSTVLATWEIGEGIYASLCHVPACKARSGFMDDLPRLVDGLGKLCESFGVVLLVIDFVPWGYRVLFRTGDSPTVPERQQRVDAEVLAHKSMAERYRMGKGDYMMLLNLSPFGVQRGEAGPGLFPDMGEIGDA
jgi:hypothetical protein